MQEENFKILANGNKVTCAVIIQDSTGKILGCHPTGKKPGECYDLPKGCADVGEGDIVAALRELREETGLELQEQDLVDLGVHEYLMGKDIHVYLHKVDQLPLVENLQCTSYFEQDGRMIKEINSFAGIQDRTKFSKSIQRTLAKLQGHLLV